MYEKVLSIDKLKVFSDLLMRHKEVLSFESHKIFVSFLIILLYLFLQMSLEVLELTLVIIIIFNEVKCTYLT